MQLKIAKSNNTSITKKKNIPILNNFGIFFVFSIYNFQIICYNKIEEY